MSAITTTASRGQAADAGTVLSALEDQLDCYRRLADLSAEQSRCVAAGDTERLLDVLQRRQQFADCVIELERDLADVKLGWPASAAAWSEADRGLVEELLGEAKRLLESITVRDEQDMLALGQRRQVVAGQLSRSGAEARTVRQINRRYAASAYGGGEAAQRMDVRR